MNSPIPSSDPRLTVAQSEPLTAQQLETVNAAYTDIRKSSGELLYPRLPVGGELGWLLPSGKTEPSLLTDSA